MERLLRRYLPVDCKSVIDVGSYDVNGTYRPLCERFGFDYTGIDIEGGPSNNVDIVVSENPFLWVDEVKGVRDFVISGQCVEHVERPWDWIRGVSSICQPGGWIFVVAPWKWPHHAYPKDCWRILPDGMAALLRHGQLDVRDVGMTEHDPLMGDCWGAARKPLE